MGWNGMVGSKVLEAYLHIDRIIGAESRGVRNTSAAGHWLTCPGSLRRGAITTDSPGVDGCGDEGGKE